MRGGVTSDENRDKRLRITVLSGYFPQVTSRLSTIARERYAHYVSFRTGTANSFGQQRKAHSSSGGVAVARSAPGDGTGSQFYN